MQDFTKQNAISNSPKTKQPKWLTKDRFWNFVFWFGMSFGLAVTFSVSSEQQTKYSLGTILIWANIIGVPLLVRNFSKTTFVKDKIFLNSEGNIINENQFPKYAFLALLAGVGLTFFISEAILPRGYSSFLLDLVFFLSLFSGISLYFIYKNCPISILFNRKAWSFEKVDNTNNGSNLFNDSYEHRCQTNSHYAHDRMYSAAHRHLPQNIHHR